MNECMYAHVTSSTMKSLAHCGRRREKRRKIGGGGQNELELASSFYAFFEVTKQDEVE